MPTCRRHADALRPILFPASNCQIRAKSEQCPRTNCTFGSAETVSRRVYDDFQFSVDCGNAGPDVALSIAVTGIIPPQTRRKSRGELRYQRNA